MNLKFYCYHDSPIGRLLLAGDRLCLDLLSFPSGKMAQDPAPEWQYSADIFTQHKRQLDEYFAGTRTVFDCEYKITGTQFMQTALRAVAKIPFGSTASYSDIATKIHHPRAVRAVGMANAKNNVPIIIPCHRVIAKNGALTGFGGGLETKQFLLDLEKEHLHGFSVRQRIPLHSL